MLSGGIAPTVGLIGSVAVHVWKPVALKAAIKAALNAASNDISAAAEAAGIEAGKDVVIKALEFIEVHKFFPGIFKNIGNITHYADVKNFVGAIVKEHAQNCGGGITYGGVNTCNAFEIKLGLFKAETGKTYGAPANIEIPKIINKYVADATTVANAKSAEVAAAKKAAILETSTKAIETTSYNLYAAIGYSILAILIIVLIMVIIYFDTQSSIYDKDEDMESVKENFERQTSQRFEEYQERMKEKQQKRKEQRDKNIQKIIEKDRKDKLLAQKVEKGFLICGCGLGGGVAPFVGLFGGLAVNEMKKAAAVASTDVGIKEAIKGVGKIFELEAGSTMEWTKMINAGNYNQKMSLIAIVNNLKNMCEDGQVVGDSLFCQASDAISRSGGGPEFSRTISEMAAKVAEAARKAASNKFNDPQMKEVMQQFEVRTSQRFHEYDESLQSKRMQCKDKCDKEIQKIILKDKLEKQMVEQFSTLQTDIQNDAIPTCICEKSMVDKMEKNCMKCAQNLGGIVAPSSGVLAGIAEGALIVWKPGALDAAIAAALKVNSANITIAAKAAGIQAGKKAVIGGLKALGVEELGIKSLESFFTESYHINIAKAARIIAEKHGLNCALGTTNDASSKCIDIGKRIGTHYANGLPDGPPATTAVPQKLKGIVAEGEKAAKAAEAAKNAKLTAEITEKETVLFEAGFNSSISSINAAIIAIVVIILVM
ncbi:hypothetical protein PFFVO_06089, partial [Plasmodium falciparum Vietnam Oak-Knoll (FVO)]